MMIMLLVQGLHFQKQDYSHLSMSQVMGLHGWDFDDVWIHF